MKVFAILVMIVFAAIGVGCGFGSAAPGATVTTTSNPAPSSPPPRVPIAFSSGSHPRPPPRHGSRGAVRPRGHRLLVTHRLSRARPKRLSRGDGQCRVQLASPGASGGQDVGFPTANASSISCPSANKCWAAGATVTATGGPGGFGPAIVLATGDRGSSWSVQPLPGFAHGLFIDVNALACPDDLTCVAVGAAEGSYAASTSDGGKSWTASVLPPNSPMLDNVTCPTSRACFAVGHSPSRTGPLDAALLESRDGGRTWRRLGLPPSMWLATDVDCSSARSCVIVGNAAPGANSPSVELTPSGGGIYVGQALIAATQDAGRSWSVTRLPSSIGAMINVTCVARQICWSGGETATGSSGPLYRSDNAGQSWHQIATPGFCRAGAFGRLPHSERVSRCDHEGDSRSAATEGNGGGQFPRARRHQRTSTTHRLRWHVRPQGPVMSRRALSPRRRRLGRTVPDGAVHEKRWSELGRLDDQKCK